MLFSCGIALGNGDNDTFTPGEGTEIDVPQENPSDPESPGENQTDPEMTDNPEGDLNEETEGSGSPEGTGAPEGSEDPVESEDPEGSEDPDLSEELSEEPGLSPLSGIVILKGGPDPDWDKSSLKFTTEGGTKTSFTLTKIATNEPESYEYNFKIKQGEKDVKSFLLKSGQEQKYDDLPVGQYSIVETDSYGADVEFSPSHTFQ